MFDSPLQSAANSTTSTATIDGKVAAAFSAAASFLFDDSVLFSLQLLLPWVAARQHGALRRRQRRLRRRISAAATFARLGRAVRASPAFPAALRSSLAGPRVPPRDPERVAARRRSFFSNGTAHAARLCAAGKSWPRPFQRYRGLWGSGVVLRARKYGSLTLTGSGGRPGRESAKNPDSPNMESDRTGSLPGLLGSLQQLPR